MSTRIECPSCQQRIEIETPVDLVGQNRMEKIYSRALAAEKVSWLLFGISGLIVGITILNALRDDAGWGGLSWAGGFFGLACWTNLIAQLLHIRAELAKADRL